MEKQVAHCGQHSGVQQQVDDLIRWQKAQNGKLDRIENRTNTILGGVVVACVMLAINLLLGKF